MRARDALGGDVNSGNGAQALNGASDHQTLVVPLPDSRWPRHGGRGEDRPAQAKVKQPEPPKPEVDPATKAKRRKRRRWIVGFLAVLIACVSVGFGAWWPGSGRYTDVPSVLLKDAATAESMLAEASLDVDYADPAYSETVAKDLVLASDPERDEPDPRGQRGHTRHVARTRAVCGAGPDRHDRGRGERGAVST